MPEYAKTLEGDGFELKITKNGSHLLNNPGNIEIYHVSAGGSCDMKKACSHCTYTNYENVDELYRKEFGGSVKTKLNADYFGKSLNVFSGVKQIIFGCGGYEPTTNPKLKELLDISRNFLQEKANGKDYWTCSIGLHPHNKLAVDTNLNSFKNNKSDIKDKLLNEFPKCTIVVSDDIFHRKASNASKTSLLEKMSYLNELARDKDVQGENINFIRFVTGLNGDREFPNLKKIKQTTDGVIDFTPYLKKQMKKYEIEGEPNRMEFADSLTIEYEPENHDGKMNWKNHCVVIPISDKRASIYYETRAPYVMDTGDLLGELEFE